MSIETLCPCGIVFNRPIQRGRPAIWCPTCRELPLLQRPPKPEVSLVAKATRPKDEEAPVILSEAHDPMLGEFPRSVRLQMEEAIRDIHEEYRVRMAEIPEVQKQPGENAGRRMLARMDLTMKISAWERDEICRIYDAARKGLYS